MKKPLTTGYWYTEKQDDGSTWVIGTDPKPGVDREVCVAAFEMQADAEYVARLHNRNQRPSPPPGECRSCGRRKRRCECREVYAALETTHVRVDDI